MKAGDVWFNPVTGMRMVVVQTPRETGGRSMTVEYELRPHTGRDAAPAHRHRIYTERFDILAGRAAYVCGDEERTAEAGETVVVLPPDFAPEGKVVVARPEALDLVSYLKSLKRNYPAVDAASVK